MLSNDRVNPIGGSAMHQTDPVTTEIIRGALVAIADEMKTNLMRTAYNPIIYESLDFTVGLFDAEGNTLSIGLGLPMFIRGLSEVVKAKIEHYGIDGIDDGDILLTNDAYLTGSHLNHIVLSLPIFHDGKIVAFASTMAHWQDIGGSLGGVTTDIYCEGLQIPIVKLFKKGVQDEELTDVVKTNVRFPNRAMGDMRAQIAAIRTGQRRVMSVVDRYGVDTFTYVCDSIANNSEHLARQEVSRWPDGEYSAEAYMDDDGVGGENLPIRVTVVISGSEMTVDLSGVSPQVAGFFNSARATGIGAAQVAFKCLTTPEAYPINEGAFRALRVELPPGRIVSALKPAAMHWWMTVPMTIIDTIFRALAPVIPERVVAGHHADLCGRRLHGVDERTGRFFARTAGVMGGGWGATHNSDGMSAVICVNDGDTHNTPIETVEHSLPILIEEYALRQDSGGAGEFRGGLGVRTRVRALSGLRLDTSIERTKCRPWGLEGAGDGFGNAVRVLRRAGDLNPPNGKVSTALEKGDVFIVESGGGGGFGNPLERPAEHVARNVRRGYVSPESAKRDYGVLVSSRGDLDLEGTAANRRAR